ncbi:hypothetical protein AMTR_s00007p00152620 [Amborella trichopoda]|uniref:Uncharacterized protein n=1 Tax=Amborella trichopoda TaxID=13333 RepID=W1P617_AMBTC|nr:hypothetical protein AMTR_s00007p00152620 [Amborella trichopoda]
MDFRAVYKVTCFGVQKPQGILDYDSLATKDKDQTVHLQLCRVQPLDIVLFTDMVRKPSIASSQLTFMGVGTNVELVSKTGGDGKEGCLKTRSIVIRPLPY